MNSLTADLPKYLEVETSRYCNRSCLWCPNSSSMSRKYQELMDWNLFLKLLEDLSEIRYSGYLAFHNYNEPLANPRLLDEISLVNQYLPKCKTSIFTNGDFLTSDKLFELITNRVSCIRITLYPSSSSKESPSREQIENWINFKKINFLFSSVNKIERVRQGLALKGSIDITEIEIISPNINTYNWRGGTAKGVPNIARESPCYMTYHSASIDFRGLMKMCCNVYSDIEEHSEYIIGSLVQNSFLELWFSPKMQLYRRNHTEKNWQQSPICKMCTQHLPTSQIENLLSNK